MRYNGHNVLAIVVAAIAIWAIGFLLYVVLFAEQWTAWMGLSEADMEKDNGRMPFMVVMPFLQAIGLSLAVKWRNAQGWLGGLVTGLLMAVFFSIAARMYSWVYSFEVNELFGLDSLHFLLTHAVAGAILGAWK
ncbi:MAG: DUF1761 domain-containing protein [Hyphomonadaceae bacterium]